MSQIKLKRPPRILLHLPSANDLSKVVERFSCHLIELSRGRNAEVVDVSIATRLCPMLMVAWSDAMAGSAKTRAAYINERFVAVHGVRAAEWNVVCDDAPFGQARLACAYPSSLIGALDKAAKEHDATLGLVRPRMLTAIQQAAPSSRQEILIIAEPDFLTLCAVRKGRVVAVHGVPWRAGGWATIPAVLARFLLCHPHLQTDETVIVIDAGASITANALKADSVGTVKLELVSSHAH